MEVHENDATGYMGMSYLLLSLLSNLLDGREDGAWTGPLTICIVDAAFLLCMVFVAMLAPSAM